MNRLGQTLVLAFAVFLLPVLVPAQGKVLISGESTVNPMDQGSEGATAEQVTLLRQRKAFLKQRLATLSPSSADYALVSIWIQELSETIEARTLSRTLTNSGSLSTKSNAVLASNVTADPFLSSPTDSVATRAQAQTEPNFKLSRPVAGATNEISELTLAWTEDKQPNKTYTITKFIVEIALSRDTLPGGRFSRPVFVREATPAGVVGQAMKVPKDTLRSGQEYYWQVWAEFVPEGSAAPLLKVAGNAPESFKTEAQTFGAFERRGLTLQRAVSGDDATEGAQFGFLKTFNKQTVYTADFALIYNKRLPATQRTGFAFQASMQGNLTSAESESEDALQFRVGAIVDRNLKRNTINHLYASFAAKYESDQEFKIGKFISENMITPTLPALGIGIPFGRSSDPVQFRWRPFFYLDLGHSFKKGDSTETQATVLRLTPRVRTMLTLNFLRRALNLNDAFIFADNFFYFLPLEETKRRHNMFTSGFVLQVTKDFGFGLTYKSGEAAPKFKPVHSFGGVLTIRFGREE